MLKRVFERRHKRWIQFVLCSAINSGKWIFSKIQKSYWLQKVAIPNRGDIRMNTPPLANEAVSIYYFNWLEWKRIVPVLALWTSVTLTGLPTASTGWTCLIFSSDERNKCVLLPPGRCSDYKTVSDLGTADRSLRMVIYFSCQGKVWPPLHEHTGIRVLTRRPARV